jgi:hypothetical protein
MVRLLFGLESLFSLWMLVDAIQRGAARYWYPIIFLPFGQVAYFFSVKIHDPEFRGLVKFFRGLTQPKVTLEELQLRADESPSFVNKLALAQALFDAGSHAEAARAFEAILATDDEAKEALYGYGLCLIEQHDYERAIKALQHLIEIKPSYHEYDAWSHLAYALSSLDRDQAALALLDELVRKAPRIAHRVVYASYLATAQDYERARGQLQLGLRDYDRAPRFQRRQDAAHARKARAMLSRLAPERAPATASR